MSKYQPNQVLNINILVPFIIFSLYSSMYRYWFKRCETNEIELRKYYCKQSFGVVQILQIVPPFAQCFYAQGFLIHRYFSYS